MANWVIAICLVTSLLYIAMNHDRYGGSNFCVDRGLEDGYTHTGYRFPTGDDCYALPAMACYDDNRVYVAKDGLGAREDIGSVDMLSKELQEFTRR